MKRIFFLAVLIGVFSTTNAQLMRKIIKITRHRFGVQAIPPVTSGTEHGVFKLTPGTLPERIHAVKASGAHLFRLSFLYGASYNIQQVADSGLDVELTFNYNQLNEHNGYATDSNAFKAALLSTLASATAKPKYICIRNEFANWNYWDTSHIDRYVNNELNPAVHIGDSMGIIVSDGGYLPNLIYTLLKYYQDTGLDSLANWLCSATGISPSSTNSPAVIRTMALYNYVLNNASPHAVYNQHWVEPLSGDTSITTTTGVLPVLINYIKSRTGRSSLTNEFHTENHSQVLLFSVCNEYESTSPLMMEYFSGDTDLGSVDLLNYYALWIASLLN